MTVRTSNRTCVLHRAGKNRTSADTTYDRPMPVIDKLIDPEKRLLILVFWCLFGWGLPVHIWGQETGQGNDSYDRVLTAIRSSQFRQAESAIDELLANDCDDHRAHLLRKTLANTLARKNRPDRAELHFDKLLQYLASGRAESRPLIRYLPQILVNLKYMRENKEPQSSKMLNKVIQALNGAIRDEPNNVGYSTALSTSLNIKARGLQKRGNYTAIQELYAAELERLRRRWRQSQNDVNSWLRLTYQLKSAAAPRHPTYQSFADKLNLERKNLLLLAMDRFPDSADVAIEFAAEEMEQISRLMTQSPIGARDLLLSLRAQLNNVREKSDSPQALLQPLVNVNKTLQKIQRELNRETLINADLPNIENIAWMQGGNDFLRFPRHKPVAIIFVSPGKDGSIKELIKLNDLSRMNEDVFDLVVLTHDYQESFLRTVSKNLKRMNGYETNRKLYVSKIQENIIDANRISGSFGIVGKSEQVAAQFGVNQLPYLVYVSRDGKCRHVTGGAIDIGGFLMTMKGMANRQ